MNPVTPKACLRIYTTSDGQWKKITRQLNAGYILKTSPVNPHYLSIRTFMPKFFQRTWQPLSPIQPKTMSKNCLSKGSMIIRSILLRRYQKWRTPSCCCLFAHPNTCSVLWPNYKLSLFKQPSVLGQAENITENTSQIGKNSIWLIIQSVKETALSVHPEIALFWMEV